MLRLSRENDFYLDRMYWKVNISTILQAKESHLRHIEIKETIKTVGY